MRAPPACVAAAAVAAILGVAVAGCGGGAGPAAVSVTAMHPASSEAVPALPSGWARLRLASGATLPYPADWQRLSGDPGTASAALLARDGTVRAYLNATPADGGERLEGWARFRLRHNAAEGDRKVRLITTQNRSGHGMHESCLVDEYATRRSSYRELACIVAPSGGGRATVLIAAAQPNAWARERPALEFALGHFVG